MTANTANFETRHPSTVHLMKQFTYEHLPAHLQQISAPVCSVAFDMAETLPDSPELTAGLRKLLEAKDCMVRAAVDADPVWNTDR